MCVFINVLFLSIHSKPNQHKQQMTILVNVNNVTINNNHTYTLVHSYQCVILYLC